MPTRATTLRLLLGAGIVCALLALALAWTLTPLAHLLEPGVVMEYRERIRALPFAPLLVVATFVAGGFIVAPSTLMIGATILLFGPVGALYAWIGLLTTALVICSVTRVAARDVVDRWLAASPGSFAATFGRRLERNGVLAVILMRLTPAPFTLQNLVAGASRISYAQILLGTAIGVLPVITLMAGVATGFDAWLAHPDLPQALLLVGAACVMVIVLWTLRRWAVRRSADR